MWGRKKLGHKEWGHKVWGTKYGGAKYGGAKWVNPYNVVAALAFEKLKL